MRAGCRSTTKEGYNMESVVILVVIVLCTGGIVWMRRRRWHAYAAPVSPGGIPRETFTLKAFTQGNACLVKGGFRSDRCISPGTRARSEASLCRRSACRSGTAATGGECATARRRNRLTPTCVRSAQVSRLAVLWVEPHQFHPSFSHRMQQELEDTSVRDRWSSKVGCRRGTPARVDR